MAACARCGKDPGSGTWQICTDFFCPGGAYELARQRGTTFDPGRPPATEFQAEIDSLNSQIDTWKALHDHTSEILRSHRDLLTWASVRVGCCLGKDDPEEGKFCTGEYGRGELCCRLRWLADRDKLAREA